MTSIRQISMRLLALTILGPGLSVIAGATTPAPPPSICIDTSCVTASPTTPPSGDAIKWHPGHYMLTYPGTSPSQRLSYFAEIADEPAVKGAQVRYNWASLEPSKGTYDFTLIQNDLNALSADGKRLIVQIMDRRFNSSNPDGIVPDYVTTDSIYGGGVVKAGSAQVAKIWDPDVMDRLIALYRALGQRFNSHPYFEGITTEETAYHFYSGEDVAAGFTKGALSTQLKRLYSAAREAWPNTNVFVYVNWSDQANLEILIEHAASLGIGIGGPDIVPGAPTMGDRIASGSVGGTDYRPLTVIGHAVQTPELGGKEGTFTPEQIYLTSYNERRDNYIFWIRNTGTGGDAQKWSTGILPFIRTRPNTRTSCPASITCNTN